jgi:spermidine synthase
LLAGFYLLRVHGMATATFVAAAINIAVALISYGLSSWTTYETAPPAQAGDVSIVRRHWPIYLAIGLSGACALGAEVIWTRLLSLLLGATVYTFSIILAVFLVGLGAGSGIGSLMARRIREPRLAIGCCQMLLAAAIGWTAYTIGASLPYWPVNPLLSKSVWFTFQVDLVRCIWAILPPTLLWGASFPFALAAVAARSQDPAQLVGSVYAANTAGAIVGALAFSLIVIPWIGTQQSERSLIALSAATALVLLVPLYWPIRRKAPVLILAGSAAVAVMLATTAPGVPPELVAYGRRVLTSGPRSRILYVGEGMNSSIAISQWDDGAVQFHVSGKVEASTEPYDMRLQRMLGHLPGLLHRNPRSALVVGFGAGVTAGSLTLYPGIERIVICEMEPLVPPVAHRFFGRENNGVWKDPRVEMVYDDARHYILTSREKFDIITSDPIHPWVKGSATLYSKEYFDLVKQHLNPGGVVTQWVPLYESDLATVRSEVATFFDAFSNGTVWGNENAGGGYDMVLLGRTANAPIDIDLLEQQLGSPGYRRVAASLRQVGFQTATNLLATYAGQASDLQPWLQNAEINRDGNLRLQYLAGLALNLSEETYIYNQMLNYRRFPEGLFAASPERLASLRAALGLP